MKERHVNYRLSAADALGVRNTDEGSVGELAIRANRSLVTLADFPYTSNLVPAGCTLHAVAFNVDTPVTTDDVGGDYTWDAELVGGVTGSLITAGLPSQDFHEEVQVTPQAGTGRIGRYFSGINDLQDYFSHANDAVHTWSGGGDKSVILWVKPVQLGSNLCPICGVWDYGNNQQGWALVHSNYLSTNAMRLWGSTDGSDNFVTGYISLPVDEFSLVYAEYEAGAKLGIEVNASGTLTQSGSALASIHNSTAAFHVGSAVDFGGTAGTWFGTMAELRMYNRRLSAAERLDFYESRTTALEATNLAAKYMLNEYAGQALDTGGSAKHLTDNGGVSYSGGPGLSNVKFSETAGSFTGGIIEVVAWYEEMSPLAAA